MDHIFRMEIEQIADDMYQNLEQQSYEWIQEHLVDVKEYLLAVIQLWQEDGKDVTMLEQQAVAILHHLIESITNHNILALADCLKYEVCTFGQ